MADLAALYLAFEDHRKNGGPAPNVVLSPAMKKIFDDTVLLLQSRAEEKQITLENNIYNPIIVEGDEKLLRQVALNLVDNGVKYTQEGGRVWIEAEEGLDHVEFIVGDNGVGIPSEHLDRIFERFYRVDKGRSRQTGGTGLGLAITRRLAELMGGRVGVTSRLGAGSRFWFSARLKPGDEAMDALTSTFAGLSKQAGHEGGLL